MALIQITTTRGALDAGRQQAIAKLAAKLVYTAEGFGASRLAPNLTWTVFEELPAETMMLGTGMRPAPLYYVRITTLAAAIDFQTKAQLGADITQALMGAEGMPCTPENATRVWVRFIDVADGDLVIGGQTTSLQGLRELVAQAG